MSVNIRVELVRGDGQVVAFHQGMIGGAGDISIPMREWAQFDLHTALLRVSAVEIATPKRRDAYDDLLAACEQAWKQIEPQITDTPIRSVEIGAGTAILIRAALAKALEDVR